MEVSRGDAGEVEGVGRRGDEKAGEEEEKSGDQAGVRHRDKESRIEMASVRVNGVTAGVQSRELRRAEEIGGKDIELKSCCYILNVCVNNNYYYY